MFSPPELCLVDDDDDDDDNNNNNNNNNNNAVNAVLNFRFPYNVENFLTS
jgi:hypothetical protein